ncbi:MAG: response regulator [Coriobacteriales bacterium]|nr:response regulator [Coriobacteriales bacterium]
MSQKVPVEHSRLERIMNLMCCHSPNMFLLFDTFGILDFCSGLFLEFKGLSSIEQIEGKTLRAVTQDFLPEVFINKAEDLLMSPRSNGHSKLVEKTIETRIQAYSFRDLKIRDYTVQVTLLVDAAGHFDGLMLQLFDNTECRQAQRAAEQANMAKSEFLAMVSHEIRTPMNVIIGLTDMMFSTKTDAQQRVYLSKIQNSSIAMLELINDILDISKIEADKFELTNECFSLKTTLDSLKSMFELMIFQKELGFTVDFDSRLPEVVWGDDKRLRQIITNLLNNAYKYTPNGVVVFSAKPIGNDLIRFDITDTGIGIKQEDMDSLFREFTQLDLERNKHISGTGLGLAITKRLVEMMDGSIEVNSVYGEGTTFSIVLPLKSGVSKDLPASYDDSIRFTAPEAKILVVDDVEVNLEIVEFMLEPYKVRATKAHDGREAVELATTNHYDLILMDQVMPTMDGIEAARLIREHGGHAAEVPIVAFTANAVEGMEAKFKNEGFDAFVSKPIDANHLAKALFNLLPKNLIVEGAKA